MNSMLTNNFFFLAHYLVKVLSIRVMFMVLKIDQWRENIEEMFSDENVLPAHLWLCV